MRFVLLDDQGTGEQFVFREPEKIISANSRQDLPRAFADISAAQAQGKWLAGWMSYELGHGIEPHFEAPTSQLLQLGVFDGPSDPPPANWLYTCDVPQLDFEPSWTEAEYLSRFNQVQAYLRAGDCYQVNLTFPMFAKTDCPATQIYAAFRRRQPGRYGAIVNLGGPEIISFSPELFFERKGRKMRMRPMKGTRPRASDPVADAALLSEMRAEPKSQAENLMIVDLLRNDLSRLCEAGSVSVPELFAVETYPTLHQMTSQVIGQLRDDVNWEDIFKSLFPCGSVTGAPKIRAMEIIEALEDRPRGAYCGSVGYIAPSGDASFSVAIRTIQMNQGQLQYDVGSGVVLDSQGPDEYRECLLKARIFDPVEDGFIETFRLNANGEIPRADRHEKRLAAAVGDKLASDVFQHLEPNKRSDMRVRAIVRNGILNTQSTALKDLPTPVKLALSRYPLTPKVQTTDVKTTARDFYDGERERICALNSADEVIFQNADGQICEGSFTSLFIKKDGKLLTPKRSCGLLPGILREGLLDEGKVIEAILSMEDLKHADNIFVGNSLRGLLPAILIDDLPH